MNNFDSGLIETLLQIGEDRRLLLADMAEAVEKEDKDAVFEIAKKLCGVRQDETNA